MKKAVQFAGLILILLLAVCVGYYAGRKSVKPIEEDTFYATIEEIREKDITVQGLENNDINKRWKFQLGIGEDTELLWRGNPIIMEDLRTGNEYGFEFVALGVLMYFLKEKKPVLRYVYHFLY